MRRKILPNRCGTVEFFVYCSVRILKNSSPFKNVMKYNSADLAQ